MASVKSFFDQQYGNVKWKFYDNLINRLRCTKDEQYTQLLPIEDVIVDTPIFACKFAQQQNNTNFLALANEDGKLAIHDITKSEERYGIRAHNNAIFDLSWMFDNMRIVTASGDHSARLFDVTNTDIRELQVYTGHTRSVKTVTFRKDDPSCFATGGRDGNIILWDTRSNISNLIGKADRTIYNSHNVKTPKRSSRKKVLGTTLSPHTAALIGAKSVTGLVFRNDDTLISCGAGDGIIKIWDLRKNYSIYKSEPLPKYKIPYCGNTTKNGFSSLIIDKDCLKLYANCLDNTIYCYNLNSLNAEPIMKYTGHQNSTFYIKSAMSRDGLYLISGSSDENAYIWNINSSKPFCKLTGHSAEVTCVAWCDIADDVKIVTCSDDMTHKIWNVGQEELPENWQIDGRGKAELLPLFDGKQSILKRRRDSININDATIATPKKLLIGCDKCDKISSSIDECCQNCTPTTTTTTNKRKSSHEIIETNPKRPRNEFEPRKLFCNLQETTNQSPTVNLPNYVIDGVAPHLNYSPPKRKSYDWLTKMRIERKLRHDFIDASSNSVSTSSPPPPPAKISKIDPSVMTTATQRRCSSPQSPILRFFKVRCDGHQSSCCKSAGQSLITNSPRATQ